MSTLSLECLVLKLGFISVGLGFVLTRDRHEQLTVAPSLYRKGKYTDDRVQLVDADALGMPCDHSVRRSLARIKLYGDSCPEQAP